MMMNINPKCLIGVCAAAVCFFQACSHGSHAGDKAAAAPDIEVSTAVTDSVTIYKKFPGTLSATASVRVVARVNGTITAKHYTSGDIVRKGQVLFSIESESYRDAVRQAEAALATARSQNDYAVKHLAAMEKAWRSDAVSEMELEQARSAARTSAAAISNAEAALSVARTRLGYCTVTAPITGRVTDNILSVGNYVSGEASPVELCEIFDNSEMIATFAIEDAALARDVARNLPQGKGTVPVSFTQPLEHKYKADYLYVAPDMDKSTGTLTVEMTIDNPYDELRPGMYVEISVPAGIDPRAVLVRDASLSTDQLGKYLYTVNDSDRVVYTPVKTGDMADDSMRIITSGLEPGARYVTSAMLKVRDGMTVNPVSSSR